MLFCGVRSCRLCINMSRCLTSYYINILPHVASVWRESSQRADQYRSDQRECVRGVRPPAAGERGDEKPLPTGVRWQEASFTQETI